MRNHRNPWALVGLAAVLVACWTADPAPGGAPEATETAVVPSVGGEAEGGDTEGGDTVATVEASAEGPLVVGEPLTLRLAPTGALLTAIRRLRPGDAARPTLRLTLDEVETPEREVTLRVFVNHPQASADTPVDHPRFVGEVGFYPTTAPPGEVAPPESSFLLDLAPTLAELPPGERLADGRFLDVTVLAVPLRDAPPPAGVSGEVILDGVRLSLHEPE